MDIYRDHGSMSCTTRVMSAALPQSFPGLHGARSQVLQLQQYITESNVPSAQLPTLYTHSMPTDGLSTRYRSHEALQVVSYQCAKLYLWTTCQLSLSYYLTIMGVFSTTIFEEAIFFGLFVSVVARFLSWPITMGLCDYTQHSFCTCSQSSCYYV